MTEPPWQITVDVSPCTPAIMSTIEAVVNGLKAEIASGSLDPETPFAFLVPDHEPPLKFSILPATRFVLVTPLKEAT
jgi:hypothetical protein